MRRAQRLFDPAQVDRRAGRCRTEVLAADLAAKGVLLQEVEARCALNVGRGAGVRQLPVYASLALSTSIVKLHRNRLSLNLDHWRKTRGQCHLSFHGKSPSLSLVSGYSKSPVMPESRMHKAHNR